MKTTNYQATTEPREGGGFIIRLPDFPEAVSEADDEAGVPAEARQLLEASIAFRVEEHEPLPDATYSEGFAVPIPPQLAAKLAVIEAFEESGFTQAELASHLGIKQQEVSRILSPHHTTKLARLEDALNAMGKHLVLHVEPLAANG